jgi:hypothetical protein
VEDTVIKAGVNLPPYGEDEKKSDMVQALGIAPQFRTKIRMCSGNQFLGALT